MKYNVNSLEIKREEFDNLYSQAEDFNFETGLGKFEIGTSKFLVVEDEKTGTNVCFAIRNANYKTANARFVLRARIDEEARNATIGFSKKNDEFVLDLGENRQDAFLTDLDYRTTGNKELLGLYRDLRPRITREAAGIVAPVEEETAEEVVEEVAETETTIEAPVVETEVPVETPVEEVVVETPVEEETAEEIVEEVAETETPIEAPVVATFMPVVMKVGRDQKASKSQFFENENDLYMIVCPDRKGELSVWLANDKIVTIDPESGKPVFAKNDAGRPWERVLQENANVISSDVKKLSRAKSREFFRKGAVATIWQEAGNKGKEKIVLTASRKEIKEFLTEARNTYKTSVEKETGVVKDIKKVFKKAKYAVTGFVAGAAITALVLASGLTTGNIDKVEAAKNFGRTQAETAASAQVAADVQNEKIVSGKLFNYIKAENGSLSIYDCMGLSDVAAQSYEKYKSGLGFVKYGFGQNDVYGTATLEGIGEALAEAAVAELSEHNIVLTQTIGDETNIKVVYPVGNKTMAEAASKDNMVSFLVLNGMSKDDAKVVADAYEAKFEACVSTTKVDETQVAPHDVDPQPEADPVDFSQVDEAIAKAIASTKAANNDTADWNIEYSSSEDQMVAVSTEDYLYIIDLSERDENGAITSSPIADQDDLLERLENVRLDDSKVSFAFNANKLYGDENLVKLVTDKFVSDNRQYSEVTAYVGGIDVETTENGTKLNQTNYMIAKQADGKNAIVSYIANEIVAKNASTEMIKLSAASFFAPVGFRNSNFVLLPAQDEEVVIMHANDYQSPKAVAEKEEVEDQTNEQTNEEAPAEEETIEEEELTL